LKEIGGGLVDAVTLKADIHARSISDQLREEQTEFAVVRSVVRRRLEALPNTELRHRLEAFDAMLLLGEYFLDLRKGTDSVNLHCEVAARTETFIAFLRHFDEVWKNECLDRSLAERATHAIDSCVRQGTKAAA
jgi:hypothetical protein